MKFKYVKPDVETPENIYGGNKAKTGDIVEYDGFFATKCAKNPNFEVVAEEPKAPSKPATSTKAPSKPKAD